MTASLCVDRGEINEKCWVGEVKEEVLLSWILVRKYYLSDELTFIFFSNIFTFNFSIYAKPEIAINTDNL